MHLHNVRALVAHDLVRMPLVLVAVDRYLIPRRDYLAARPLVHHPVVNPLVPGHVGPVHTRVGVLIHAVDGIVHAVEAVPAVRRCVGARPGHRLEGIGAAQRNARSVRREVVRERHVPVVRYAELRLLDAEEKEREIQLHSRRREAVVRVDVLLRPLAVHPERRVWRVVRYLVHIIVAVEKLHRNIGHARQHHLPLSAGNNSVPPLPAVLLQRRVVVFLLDLHFGAGTLHRRPLVRAAVVHRRRVPLSWLATGH